MTSIQRITVLYILFFVVIALSLVLSFNSAAFNEGFEMGHNDAMNMFEESNKGKKVQVVYDLPASTDDLEYSLPLYAAAGGDVEISVRPTMMDVKAVSSSGRGIKGLGMPIMFGVFSILMYGAVFVIIFIILTSLRRSIRRGNLMEGSVIPLTRAIGILLICASLFHSLMSYMEKLAVADYFAGSNYSVNTSFPFDFMQIIIGILIFVIAEVFAIGYSLSEEQKLTI